ncbi:Hsp20/alpha crystallin family protein [Micromonospora sp. NPDC049559]|uniref:Hsp20/alpha crystallin family protein n=1 Tax=Micromonospora sp. NPDC049559 TaxID=3155923 RepID=UPI00344ADD9C
MVLAFDPFREFDRLAEQMLAGTGSVRGPLAMPMDLYRSGDHYVLHCDLPGVDPGSVEINVEGSVLTITAERSARPDDVRWLSRERRTGRYQRRLSLGDGVDATRITATHSDGVLTVTIPVAEHAKPRRIPVTVGGSGQVLSGTASETPALERSAS